MYTRAYPPRNTSIPDNYSGVALLTNEEEQIDTPPAEPEQPMAEATVAESEPTAQEAGDADAQENAPPNTQQTSATPLSLPASFATSDLLLLAIAALMSQNGNADGELLMILLLLMLGE